ncbi:DUF447 domain-containing protein [Ancylobacter defluvii]|uniref:DUF447 family protein n=1 Tax=Ancylobacter defluvii TaxID=1282440 RepID=A0A9W6NAU8_9HYPH|nr:DUF447 domain-containing protein [Ancylobacter defluvii]MBS7589267.1 DUF447 family protein [Ancylobacter defluvii]GLK84879.1 hypothetical protein GCM10017653_29490 [Ancylobacter defluvii]
MIRETIVTTRSRNGERHIAPMGATVIEGGYLLQPFKPSRTLDNLVDTQIGVINFTDDVRLIAACVLGKRIPVETQKASYIDCPRLVGALSHDEITVDRVEEDRQRPRIFCKTYHSEGHHRFLGLNRAKAAVLEAAVLISRLNILSDEKIDAEMAYLAIAVEKTAGPEEQEAWEWMIEAVATHRQTRDGLPPPDAAPTS